MLYQTDFDGKIREFGCLFMSLLDIVRDITGCKIRKHDVETLYDILIKDGCMNSNCYVKNHETVLEKMLEYYAYNKKVKYVGAQYLSNKNDSWGRNEGDYIIYQVKAPSFSHFRRMSYDPYRPTLNFNSILSVRYYTVY